MAIEAGLKGIAGSRGLTVKRSKFEHVGGESTATGRDRATSYIADNEFIGKADPNTLVGFAIRPLFDKVPTVRKEHTQQLSQFAVKLYGSVTWWPTTACASSTTASTSRPTACPTGYPNMIRERMPVSNDFYNNDISLVHDDCIEADGALYNMRVYRNLCAQYGGRGLSGTARVGRLAYFIRNIVYHDPGLFAALKLGHADGRRVLSQHVPWRRCMAARPRRAR